MLREKGGSLLCCLLRIRAITHHRHQRRYGRCVRQCLANSAALGGSGTSASGTASRARSPCSPPSRPGESCSDGMAVAEERNMNTGLTVGEQEEQFLIDPHACENPPRQRQAVAHLTKRRNHKTWQENEYFLLFGYRMCPPCFVNVTSQSLTTSSVTLSIGQWTVAC